jgi:hypothetical protein
MVNPPPNCIAVSEVVLDHFRVHLSVGACVGALFVYLATLHILTYVALLNAARKGAKGAQAISVLS